MDRPIVGARNKTGEGDPDQRSSFDRGVPNLEPISLRFNALVDTVQTYVMLAQAAPENI
jgi:hypothetical protein